MTRQDRTADTLRARDGIESLRSAILTSDAIVIGAGSGLSTAAGFRYSGKFFKRYFGDFMRKYGIRDMYSGGFFLGLVEPAHLAQPIRAAPRKPLFPAPLHREGQGLFRPHHQR